MSGHSKWSTIKHKKGAQDAKRSRVFTRLIKELTVAARLSGGDPDSNSRLRTAIQAAKGANMPGDNITRAIKRGTGELEGVNYEEVSYEGYAPGGVAVMVSCLTDNRNRTVSDIRHVFSKYNGSMGESGCVSWMFQRKGMIILAADQIEETDLMNVVLEYDVDDVKSEDEMYQVVVSPDALPAVREALEGKGLKIESAETTYVPVNDVTLTGEAAVSAVKLLEALEEHDDVQNVASNLDVDPAELDAIMAAI